MQTPDEIRRDLPPELEDAERDLLVELAIRLQMQRPSPPAVFRQELRRALLDTPEVRQPEGMVPRTVRMPALAYAASGLLLLAVTAIGLAGVGPFAPG